MMCGSARLACLIIQSFHAALIDGLVWLPFLVGLAAFREKASYLVAVHHEVVGGDQGFEDHHPARVGRPLKQRVRQMGDVYVHVVGAVDEIWMEETGRRGYKITQEQKESGQRSSRFVLFFFAFTVLTQENKSPMAFQRAQM